MKRFVARSPALRCARNRLGRTLCPLKLRCWSGANRVSAAAAFERFAGAAIACAALQKSFFA
jgi:hypothetical protein